MKHRPVTRRTFPARYVRALVPPVVVQAVPGGVGLALDLSALLTRLTMREGLEEAGVRPGGV